MPRVRGEGGAGQDVVVLSGGRRRDRRPTAADLSAIRKMNINYNHSYIEFGRDYSLTKFRKMGKISMTT